MVVQADSCVFAVERAGGRPDPLPPANTTPLTITTDPSLPGAGCGKIPSKFASMKHQLTENSNQTKENFSFTVELH